MIYLIDTHALLWFYKGAEEISKKAKAIIEDKSNICVLSIASLWEIVLKLSIGKLELAINLPELQKFLHDENIRIVPISFEHLNHYLSLPLEHRDPFDRLIIAQAQYENYSIITKDATFKKYKIKTIW